jgi:hypothetical protein
MDGEGHNVALHCRGNHVEMGKGKRALEQLPCRSEEETKGPGVTSTRLKRRGGVRLWHTLELGAPTRDTDPGTTVRGGAHARCRGSGQGRETWHVGQP